MKSIYILPDNKHSRSFAQVGERGNLQREIDLSGESFGKERLATTNQITCH